MENFFKRINVNASLKEISRLICSKCGLEGYISSQIIEVGYENEKILRKQHSFVISYG